MDGSGPHFNFTGSQFRQTNGCRLWFVAADQLFTRVDRTPRLLSTFPPQPHSREWAVGQIGAWRRNQSRRRSDALNRLECACCSCCVRLEPDVAGVYPIIRTRANMERAARDRHCDSIVDWHDVLGGLLGCRRWISHQQLIVTPRCHRRAMSARRPALAIPPSSVRAVSACCRTGLRMPKTEIGKTPAETRPRNVLGLAPTRVRLPRRDSDDDL